MFLDVTFVDRTRCHGMKEGMKDMVYLTMHSTHFIYGYMTSNMRLNNHSDSERGNPLPPHRLLFPISSKGPP